MIVINYVTVLSADQTLENVNTVLYVQQQEKDTPDTEEGIAAKETRYEHPTTSSRMDAQRDLRRSKTCMYVRACLHLPV